MQGHAEFRPPEKGAGGFSKTALVSPLKAILLRAKGISMKSQTSHRPTGKGDSLYFPGCTHAHIVHTTSTGTVQ